MSIVRRWIFAAEGHTYTVPLNPEAMQSLFGQRAVTAKATLAGRVLLTEGVTPPVTWSFSGQILDAEHFEALRHWVYDINQRVTITDHFGRRIVCALQSFTPEPKRAVGHAWRHTYTVKALVLSVSAPPVVER